MIGIEKGGIHAAEALQLARQFMFLQLYYHHVRIAYDIHLSEFMVQWLKTYPTAVEGHMRMTDNEVLAAMATAASDNAAPGHDPALRIMQRRHFRKIYERNALDQRVHPNAVDRVAVALKAQFGEAAVRERLIPPKQQNIDFPILLNTGEISTSRSESTIYADFKPAAVGFVLVDPEKKKDARTWLAANKKTISRNRWSSAYDDE